MIPFLDLRESNAGLEHVFARVVQESSYILGPNVEAFEDAWAKTCNAKYCVGVDNGLEALRIGLLAAGIGPGDEVLVPSHTYIATWLAVTHTGAHAVPVEPKRGRFVLDAEDFAPHIGKRTAAILPVHLYGEPCEMEGIRKLASSNGLLVLEDAAQSHGLPMMGDVACYSFYPTKNLGALGDAGGIVTNDEHIARKARLLRNYGARAKDVYSIRGYNARLDELQAALLLAKLPRLAAANELRATQAKVYNASLRGLPGLLLPPEAFQYRVWHQYVVRHPQRDRLMLALKERGIGTRIHYPTPPHKQECYAGIYGEVSLPVAEQLAREVLSLPLGYDFDIMHVCEAVKDAVASL